jgi:phosphopantothenoylcysteine decarboxylase/phosphopantothenate--cysteine ligase
MSRVLVGVTGGIAAYKAATVVSRLHERGEVRVLMTQAAEAFVAPLTFAALSDAEVLTDQGFLAGKGVPHVRLAEWAEVYVVVPCTANSLAEIALGLASNVVTAVALAARAPMVLVPAMETAMWQNPAIQGHVQLLRGRGVMVLEPDSGRLASGREGVGRLPEPEAILEAVYGALAFKDYAGVRAVVTAGPTREPLDPVRFLSNPSSGRMGFALARSLARRGADVTLVAGPVALPTPHGVRRVDVMTTQEMWEAVRAAMASGCDLVIGAAAPADFRPKVQATEKIPKEEQGSLLPIEPTVDIMGSLGRERAGRRRPVLVGFAAESGDARSGAREKRRRKLLDLVVGNNILEPGAGFGGDRNHVFLVGEDWDEEVAGTKDAVADHILDRVLPLL